MTLTPKNTTTMTTAVKNNLTIPITTTLNRTTVDVLATVSLSEKGFRIKGKVERLDNGEKVSLMYHPIIATRAYLKTTQVVNRVVSNLYQQWNSEVVR